MNAPYIAEIELTLKKGSTVKTRWLVERVRPFPDLERAYSLEWRNHGGIMPQYGTTQGHPERYRAALLAEGITPPAENWDRTHLAGFDGNPGSFALRGQDLGEVSAEDLNLEHPEWDTFRVRGYNPPTPGEREFLRAQVSPALHAFILANRDGLRDAAADALRRCMEDRISRARAQLAELEAMIPAAVETFKR